MTTSSPETELAGSSLATSEFVDEDAASRPSREAVLATLGRWLENIEEGSAGRAR
jgi:hypothetical protein